MLAFIRVFKKGYSNINLITEKEMRKQNLSSLLKITVTVNIEKLLKCGILVTISCLARSYAKAHGRQGGDLRQPAGIQQGQVLTDQPHGFL